MPRHEDELNKAPDTVVQAQDGVTAKEPKGTYVWSENLCQDIALARQENQAETAMV